MEATRMELVNSIAQARSLSDEWLATAARLEERLTALPAEPVRLRVDCEPRGFTPSQRVHDGRATIATVWMNNCAAAGHDAELMAQAAANYRENAAALKAADALADAVVGMQERCIASVKSMQALTAYRAARGVKV